jgi:uncharacterized membrane protein YfcA
VTNELIILLTLVCLVCYSFEIVFGLAGTILMLMVMSFYIDAQILVATIGLYRTPGHINRDVLLNMLGFAAVGALVGLVLFYYFSSDNFRILLASVITIFGIYLIAAPGRMKMRPPLARSLDTFAGLSQGLFGISGPIAMTRLLATFDNKTVIRNNALAFFLVLNLVRVAGYGINDTISDDILRAMLWSAPVLVVALWFANYLHFKVNETWFRRVVAWVILLGGLSLFLH